MRKIIILVLSVILLSLCLISCNRGNPDDVLDFIDSEYDSLYFPKPEEPDFLYTVDRWQLTNYEKVMLASMQGITAKDKPCIYVLENENYKLWLDEMIEKKGIQTEEANDIYALLTKVADSINGYILYDLSDGTSLNVATSLAGINRAILVDQSIEAKIKELGFECIMDVRGFDDK